VLDNEIVGLPETPSPLVTVIEPPAAILLVNAVPAAFLTNRP